MNPRHMNGVFRRLSLDDGPLALGSSAWISTHALMADGRFSGLASRYSG